MSKAIHITTSQVNLFKDCRRRYELSYRKMLKPREEPEALSIGSSYHAKVEQILTKGSYEPTYDYTDSMAEAFRKYVLPQLGNVIAVERKFSYRLSHGIYLDGKIDALSDTHLIEHKTTGQYIDEDYIYKVNYANDQVSNYLIANGNMPILYTVMLKPTIRQKKNETLSEYLNRCQEWYGTDTERKVRVFEVYRTDEELEEQKKALIEIAKEIRRTKNFYRNERSCSIIKCPFQAICHGNEYENLMDFIKKEKKNEEL